MNAPRLTLSVDNDTQAQRPSDLARRWQCSERHVRNLIPTATCRRFGSAGRPSGWKSRRWPRHEYWPRSRQPQNPPAGSLSTGRRDPRRAGRRQSRIPCFQHQDRAGRRVREDRFDRTPSGRRMTAVCAYRTARVGAMRTAGVDVARTLRTSGGRVASGRKAGLGSPLEGPELV
jgi:hypothetical protein